MAALFDTIHDNALSKRAEPATLEEFVEFGLQPEDYTHYVGLQMRVQGEFMAYGCTLADTRHPAITELISFCHEKDLIKYKRETVGFVWQNNARNLIPYLTAIQNVEMPLLLSGHKNRRQRAEELLDMVGLSARKNSLLGQLSGGEQQRVAIAIALSNNPSLLLADEPTGAVDTKTAAMVLDVFKQLNRQMGVTIIIVTHDTNLSKSIDRVVAIRDGRTSSEMLRKKTEVLSFGELEKMSEQQRAEHEKLMQQSGSDHEELVVLDRAGRLQIPKEYLEALGIRGGDKVRVELEDGKISVYNSDYNSHG